MHLIRRTSSRRAAAAAAAGGCHLGWSGDRSSRNLPSRSSSRRNKENGSRPGSFKINRNHPQQSSSLAGHLRNSTNQQQSISSGSINAVGGAKVENVLRRNSKASAGGGSTGLMMGGGGDNDDDDEESEQSQKKQRIVDCHPGSVEKLRVGLDEVGTMTTTTGEAIGVGEESAISLHRPPRV